MKHTQSFIIKTVIIIALVTAFTGASFAWLSRADLKLTQNINKGSVIRDYFHCGSGTKNDPYVITRPIHYFHMTELYQRRSDEYAKEGIYYQLGYDLDGDGKLEVYAYDRLGGQIMKTDEDGNVITDEDGKPVPETSYSLNMGYYSKGDMSDNSLLPIGTSDVPFSGIFDGSGLTVENLSIAPEETVGDETYGTSDVGIFGYVSENAVIKNTYYDNVTIYLGGTDVTRTTSGHNTGVHDRDNDPGPETVYAGYLAGHVKTSQKIENVYLNNCTMVGGDAAYTGYGYFGCVEDSDTGEMIGTIGTEVSELRKEGDEAGFGGSMDMQEMYSRLNDVSGGELPGSYNRYRTAQTIVVDEKNKTRTITDVVRNGNATNSRQIFATENAGSYIFSSSPGNAYRWLAGLDTNQTMTTTVYTYTVDPETGDYKYIPAYYIHDGEHYLTVNVNGQIADVTDVEQASVWALDSDNHLYTYAGNELRYINVTGTSQYERSLSIGDTPQTVWAISEAAEGEGTHFVAVNVSGKNFYLVYNNSWIVTALNEYYLIGDTETGAYLSVSGPANFTGTDETAASKWILSNPSGNTTFMTFFNGNQYYLGTDNNILSLVTAATTWTKDGDSYYITNGTVKEYLVYDQDNGYWVVKPTDGYYITDENGNNYMTNNGTAGVQTAASERQAAVWFFSNYSESAGSTTQIYTYVNGTGYYLRVNNGVLGLSNSSNNATWTRAAAADGGFTYRIGDYYLEYDGGWKVFNPNVQVITDGNGHYLSLSNNGTVTNASSADTATYWSVDGNNRIYATAGNGTTYYLRINNNALTTNTNQNYGTQWTSSDGHIYNGNNYITYDNGWKITSVSSTKYITDGNGNYLRLNSGNLTNTTDVNQATAWTFGNATATNPAGYISATSGNTTYYLRNNNGALTTTTNRNNRTSWSNNGTNIYNGSYYLICQNGTWTLSTNNTYTYNTYKIGTGSNYICVDANGNLTNGTNANTATEWTFSNTTDTTYPSGTISTKVGDKIMYLKGNGTSLSLTEEEDDATNWENYRSSSNRYLRYSVTSGRTTTYYYLTRSSNSWTLVTSRRSASTFTFSSVSHTETYKSIVTASADYPQVSFQDATMPIPSITVTKNNTPPGEISFTHKTEDFSITLTENNQKLHEILKSTAEYKDGSYVPIRTIANDNEEPYTESDRYDVSPKNTGYIVGGNYSNNDGYESSVRISQYANSNIEASYVNGSTYKIKASNASNYLCVDANGNLTNGTSESSATEWTFSNTGTNPSGIISTKVGDKTMYLKQNGTTGLALDENERNATNWSNSQSRLSYRLNGTTYYFYLNGNNWQLGTNNNRTTLTFPSQKVLSKIFTFDGSTRELNDTEKASPVYQIASEQLEEELINSNGNVYGLHFMDNSISKDNTIRAQKVTVLNRTYENYELPESSIDFNLIEKGTISFFAGAYYGGGSGSVNAFFTLNKIFRDADNNITDIKEIKKIYEYEDPKDPRAHYVYLYDDGTYSNFDGTYSGEREIPDGYKQQVFDSTRLTNPGTLTNHAIYYFEIPANAGEYALGSVSGKTGAYLIYLDIGTNGGDTVSVVVSDEGNSVTKNFKVEYRDRPQTANRTILQFQIAAPAGADPSSYSVSVKFDDKEKVKKNEKYYDLFSEGLYTITLTNKTDKDIGLIVYLCDNDDDHTNEFPYAYRIVYTNNDHDQARYVNEGTGIDFMKSVNGFIIPASGAVYEQNLTEQ